MPTASERVGRLLAMVPFIVNHPGVRMEELARVFGANEAQIRRDLELLFMVGTPPYGPGDLVEVDIEEDQVWVGMADHLERPQRLSRPEAVSLYVRAKTLAGTPGLPDSAALSSALAKIEDAFGEDALGELKGHVESAEQSSSLELLEVMRSACESSERLDIDYFSFYADELTSRRIDPEKVFWSIGYWYVVAWDEAAGGERIFRLDRVRSVERTGERFEPRGLQGAGRPLYSPSPEDISVRLQLSPGAYWVAEYYECSDVSEVEGHLLVTLSVRSPQWLAKLALRLGSLVEILEPVRLREQVRELASETLSLYD